MHLPQSTLAAMINGLFALIWTLVSLFKHRRDVALEILALRQQLIVYKRLHPRPPLQPKDRLFWIWLSRIWSGWRQSLVIVQPATVVSWHRRGFRFYWMRLSQRKVGGRPAISSQL